MNLLFARHAFGSSDECWRDLAGLAVEATRRGHRITILTGQKETPPENFPAVQWVVAPHGEEYSHYVRAFQAACRSGKYDGTLAFETISGADLCLPDGLPLYPQPPEKKPGLFQWERRRWWNMRQEAFRTPSQTHFLVAGELQKLTLRLECGVVPARLHAIPSQMDDISREAQPSEAALLDLRKEFGCIPQENPSEEALLILQYLTPGATWHSPELLHAFRAFGMLSERVRMRCRYVLVDPDDARPENVRDALRDIATENDFPIAQLYCVRRERLLRIRRTLLTAADLLLMPAQNAFTGFELTDALACGLPMICTSGCAFSQIAQSAGCFVLQTPLDQEIFNESLAYSLPMARMMRKMLANRAAKLHQPSRAGSALDFLEKLGGCAVQEVPQLPEEQSWELIRQHRQQLSEGHVLKNDRKRAISRCTLPNGDAFIVKEFRHLHLWDGDRHPRKCLRGTGLLRLFTPQCRAAVTDPETRSRYLVFEDCGKGNFYYDDYLGRQDLPELYTACGTTLALLHTAGLYHKDTKPANFVVNDRQSADLPNRVCLVDCDNVEKLPLPIPQAKRAHNLAQFVAGTGILAKHDFDLWLKLVRAFQDGYNRHALLAADERDALWNCFWKILAERRHIEYKLPFLCQGEDLKKLRNALH